VAGFEGQNLVTEERWAEGRLDRLPELAADLARLEVAVIVTAGFQSIRAVQQATQTIPVVMAVSNDPVGAGLELLKALVPKMARVGVLWNPAVPDTVLSFKETQEAAGALGLELQLLEARTPAELENALEIAIRDRPDALVALLDNLTFAHHARIAQFATRSGLPATFDYREFAHAGGLMSYGPNVSDMWYRTPAFIDKIFKGAQPADLPIEQSTTFDFVINLKTAQALRLTIPQSVLQQATEVIQEGGSSTRGDLDGPPGDALTSNTVATELHGGDYEIACGVDGADPERIADRAAAAPVVGPG
jgi:putative tryptophan/tyrosine transport system substrate-binding protein